MEKKKKKSQETIQEPVAVTDLQVHICSAGTVLSHSSRISSDDLEKEMADQDQKSL